MKTPVSRSLIATAIALLPLAAAAQSSVNLQGRVDMGVQRIDDGVSNMTRADSGTYTASRLTIRGTEDLGGGMTAQFFLESGFSVDTGATAAKFFNRGAYVGLSGSNWGIVTLGRQYVPIFWPLLFGDETGPHRLHGYSATQSVQRSNFVRITSAASPIKSAGTLDSISGGLYSIGITSAFEDNLVVYRTPNMGGATVMLAYGFAEGYTGGSSKVLGGNVEYRNGPLYLGAGFNSKEGRIPSGGTGEQTMREQTLTGSYKVADSVWLWGNVHPWKFNTTTGSMKGRDWMAGVSVRSGLHMVWANYADKKVRSTCVECGSSGFGIGYHYQLSKRTELYTSLAQVNNDNNSANTLVGIAPGAPGKSIRGLAAGIAHVF